LFSWRETFNFLANFEIQAFLAWADETFNRKHLTMLGTWELLIILVIIIVLFGTKRLRNIGGDLGSAIKNFRQSMRHEEKEFDETNKQVDEESAKQSQHSSPAQVTQNDKGQIIEGQITEKKVGNV
jgi:sec-independent protein translocase protein TatA